ncbi:hypothetical protein GCM10011494_17290 [Novosphingobium endophyticum]|uniref:Uncharacterized protein n=1 Tax=Novosphingobium endophyticum TaxID=1955250 RepID=A0A916TSI6_9SPHN|nr:hypothetical protein [Novosphingobium endophyticum]GGB99382.1 hypothetical protein GCM10011494_17290 [Novosphingobium endophyticum]
MAMKDLQPVAVTAAAEVERDFRGVVGRGQTVTACLDLVTKLKHCSRRSTRTGIVFRSPDKFDFRATVVGDELRIEK